MKGFDFEALANEHKDAVYRQMLRVCGNREDAEDVLIDALLRAWQSLHQLEDDRAFRAWLGQIARRVCWNLRGRAALMPLLQLSTLPDGGSELAAGADLPDAQVEAAQMKTLFSRALESVPEPYREVYRLRDLEDIPGEEVAARLGISLAAMKSRLHRARTMLRTHLETALGTTRSCDD